jgi:CheY-like chemotaxis protein
LKNILVVDDDPIILKWYDEILNLPGYTVMSCRDGRSALNAIREGAATDLVITDYRMPGMDGLELVERIKMLAPSIPVIMSSVNMRSDIYQKAIGLGIAAYLLKPVGQNELRQAVEVALEMPAKLHV